MQARRRAEGKTVELFLDLPYKIKQGEEFGLFEAYEIDEVNEKIRAAGALVPKDMPDRNEVLRERSSTIKAEYLADAGSLAPRITARLLYAAVELRYRKDTQRGSVVEVPRKGPDKTKPGVWWGDLQVQIEDFPVSIDVPVVVAQWLVATWEDDKVQNGLDARSQAWANVLEKEIERLKAELEGPAKA